MYIVYDAVLVSTVWQNESARHIHMCVSHLVVSDSLGPHGLQLTRLFCPWDSPGKNTGGRCHFLLQGIFRIQESNLGPLHCRQMQEKDGLA